MLPAPAAVAKGGRRSVVRSYWPPVFNLLEEARLRLARASGVVRDAV
jgi:hypothetical protein